MSDTVVDVQVAMVMGVDDVRLQFADDWLKVLNDLDERKAVEAAADGDVSTWARDVILKEASK